MSEPRSAPPAGGPPPPGAVPVGGTGVSLCYGPVEEELRATVRRVLEERCAVRDVLARVETAGYDVPLWRTLAAGVGCAGLPVPQESGGAGASWREVAVVAEEMGRAVAPVPYLGGAMATAALLRCDAPDLLAAAAGGDLVVVLAVPLATPPGGRAPDAVRADGDALTGTLTGVADALAADLLLVPASGALWAVAPADAVLRPVTSLDLTRPLCDVSLAAAPARRLAAGALAAAAWSAALLAGAVVLASEQLGVADWCLTSTVDYVRQRYQFGRPVGSFQAVKHRLAQLWVEVTQARAVARYAAGCLAAAAEKADTPGLAGGLAGPGGLAEAGGAEGAGAGGPAGGELAVAAALAQAHCGPVAVRAAEECVQLHGGIGFTWEHPAHLYLKRAKSAAIALGTAARHRAALGDLLDLPPG